MSLVGIVKCKDGLVAIGDYQGTKCSVDEEGNYIRDEYGNIKKQKEEGRVITKVFKFKSFVLATAGINWLYDENDIKMEEYIDREYKLNPEQSVFDFMAKVESKLLPSADIDSPYHFIIGFYDGDYKIYCYTFVKKVNIGWNRIIEEDNEKKFAGNDYYFNQIIGLKVNYSDMYCEDVAKKLSSKNQ